MLYWKGEFYTQAEVDMSPYLSEIQERMTRNRVPLIWIIREAVRTGILPTVFTVKDVKRYIEEHEITQVNGEPYNQSYVGQICYEYSLGKGYGMNYLVDLEIIDPSVSKGRSYYFPSLSFIEE